MLNEQGSGRRILSDALHHRPGVVKNEQESSHLTRWMRTFDSMDAKGKKASRV
jgi:hypothetical protein